MDIFQKARQAGAEIEASERRTLKGRLNVYACTPSIGVVERPSCGYWIVTVDRDAGVTPMFVKCGHCGETATSRMYKVGDGLEPTHEWFRPASADELPDGYTVGGVASHLENGGLLLRPIGDGKWLAPTPETIAFVESEQRMFRAMANKPPPILPGLPGGPPYVPTGKRGL